MIWDNFSIFRTSSNQRLEIAGLNALEELLFKMLGMSGEDSNVCLVCKGNWILFGRPLYWKRDRKLALLSILTKEVYSRKKIAGGGRGEMFICSKLRQNLSEMEVSTFERTQRVIWDHLLPFKGEIIQKQALFSFRWITISLLRCLFCFFFRSLFLPAKLIFSSKSRKESSGKMFPFKV